jgi:hypothetical protein
MGVPVQLHALATVLDGGYCAVSRPRRFIHGKRPPTNPDGPGAILDALLKIKSLYPYRDSKHSLSAVHLRAPVTVRTALPRLLYHKYARTCVCVVADFDKFSLIINLGVIPYRFGPK